MALHFFGKFKRFFALFLASLLFAAISAAGLPVTPSGDGKAAIAGVVVDGATNLPIESLAIYAYDANGEVRAEAITCATGHYLLEGLESGAYYDATESRELGYIDEVYGDLECIGNACDRKEGKSVAVRAGELVSSVDFRLHKGITISGWLLDADTLEPLPHALVRLGRKQASLDFLGHQLTGEDGSYRFIGLPRGAYRLSAYELAGAGAEVVRRRPCPAQFLKMNLPDEWSFQMLPLCLRDIPPAAEIDGFESGGLGAWSASEGG